LRLVFVFDLDLDLILDLVLYFDFDLVPVSAPFKVRCLDLYIWFCI
jgi:hypothetical protein